MKRSLYKRLAVLSSALLFISAGATAASAEALGSNGGNFSHLTSDDVAYIQSQMTELGVTGSEATAFLERIDRGERLDSTKNVQPVRTEERTVHGQLATVSVFPDGSRSSTAIEKPTVITEGSDIKPKGVARSITECVQGSGVGWYPVKGCKVRTDQFQFNMDFRADAMLGISGQFTSYITSIYGPTMAVGGGTYSNLRVEMMRKEQGGGLPAEARAVGDVNVWTGGYTASVTLHINYTQMWDTSP